MDRSDIIFHRKSSGNWDTSSYNRIVSGDWDSMEIESNDGCIWVSGTDDTFDEDSQIEIEDIEPYEDNEGINCVYIIWEEAEQKKQSLADKIKEVEQEFEKISPAQEKNIFGRGPTFLAEV